MISSGAPARRGVALLGFLCFVAWNFLAIRTLFALAEWNLSVWRSLGVATLVSWWLVVTYALLNARRLK